MEKYKNIKEYCEKNNISKEDFRFYMLRTAIDFGSRVAHIQEEELQDVENLFTTIHFFNDIINKVE